MKKLLTLTLLFLLPLLAKAYDAEVDGIYYNLDTEKKEAEVTYQKYDENNWRKYQSPYSGEVNIPEKIIFDGAVYTVIAIGEGAFYCCRDLNSIAIPNSVITIKDNAIYGCTALTSITIPNSVTYIGKDNFHGRRDRSMSNNLTSIKVKSGNPKYDSRNDCNAIIETASNTLIAGCGNSTIPNTVTKIGDCAFCSCNISSVTIPNSVTCIGDYAFYFCFMEELTIGNSVKTIGKGAFHDNKMAKLIFPQSVETIGEEAFSYCDNLLSISIPSNVVSIGTRAFTGCVSLFSIVVEEGNRYYDSRDNCCAIIESSTNKLINGCKKTIIPYGVTTIGDGAITNIEDPFSVDIPNSVTVIEDGAFGYCHGLTSVVIPNSVTTIGTGAFAGCYGLTSLTIPNSVKNIEDFAFYGCSKITSLTISESLETIGNYAFGFLYNLNSLTIPSQLTTIGDGAFSSCNSLTEILSMITDPFEINPNCWQYLNTEEIPLYVPYGSKSKYESTAGWNLFKNIVEMEPTGIAIDETNFPDENFRQYVKDNCDPDKDGYLSEEEIEKVSRMDIHSNEIASLKGIEFFTALTYLDCSRNNLTTLDVSKNTALKDLICLLNKITELDLSNNPSLTNLNCNLNELAELDLSKNVALQTLRCMQNQLTTLDVRNNHELEELIFGENQISQIDVSNNLKVWLLSCENNMLSSLDFSNNTFLKELDCSGNQLSTLDLTKNIALKKLSCGDNHIANLDFSNHPELYGVWCNNNMLTTLNVSGCPKLVTLHCSVNQLSGSGMDTLISGLSENGGNFYAIKPDESEEHNKVSKPQVAAANEKDWTVYYWNTKAHNWEVYEGSEPELTPVDNGEFVDLGTEISEDTNLDGNVIGNIYYSISSGDGSYNPTEGCLVLTKPTNDLAINLYDIFSEYFKEQFNGLAFKLAPGKGSIKVEAETQGNMVLKVKIGNNDPIEMELDGKLKVKFPYNVSEETLVYIYGGMSTAGAKATGGTRASADADLLKIYGFEIVSDASGIEATESGLPANADAPVYNLNGQRVDTPTKGIYIKNGRKVLVK